MKRYWFKRKTYGWGWYPSTWQGWGILLVYSVLLILFLHTFPIIRSEDIGVFMLGIVFLTSPLIAICYVTGESPRWQWGEKSKEP